jgi:hypothetical protein
MFQKASQKLVVLMFAPENVMRNIPRVPRACHQHLRHIYICISILATRKTTLFEPKESDKEKQHSS